MPSKFALSFVRSLSHESSPSLMDQSTLVLTQIFFRHGHRSPDQAINYPGDPYEKEPYMPYGKGELTLLGRKQSYFFGETLRQRYARFLGPEYYHGIIEASSSEVSRTRTTLQLVLAGLFPPSASMKIHESLNWHPVPFTYAPLKQDQLIGKAVMQMYQHEDHPEFRKTANCQEVIKCIEEKLKWKVKNHAQCLLIFDTVKSQIDFGLKMPAWCTEIYPHKLKIEFDRFIAHNFSRNEFLVQGHGAMIKKINDVMCTKVANDNNMPMPKMVLYSGHDINLVGLLNMLGNFSQQTWPNFMSNLTFELHRINDEYYVKILYQDGQSELVNRENEKTIQILKMPNCNEEMCKLSEFTKHVQQYFPQQTTQL